MVSRILSGCLNASFRCLSNIRSVESSALKSLEICVKPEGSLLGSQLWGIMGLQQIRFRMHDYFRRPNEFKRINKHGWKKRMSTQGGRKIIMLRLLKGRHVLTH